MDVITNKEVLFCGMAALIGCILYLFCSYIKCVADSLWREMFCMLYSVKEVYVVVPIINHHFVVFNFLNM